jgi:hypothetical protein
MNKGDCPMRADKNISHSLGMISEPTVFSREKTKKPIESSHKLFQIKLGYLVKVVDYPTTIFVFPIICQTNEIMIAVDIRSKWECPAGN